MLDVSLVVMAAGSGSRLGLPVKKQFLYIDDEPLWLYVTKKISSFYNFKKIIITCDNKEYYEKFLINECEFVNGDEQRQGSLLNALDKVDSKWVLVLDSARFGVEKHIVDNLINEALKGAFDCISPKLDVSDTVIYDDEFIDRSKLMRIQTPQLSKTHMLKKALMSAKTFTDDSSAVKSVGGKIGFISGDEKLEKITFLKDLKLLKDLAYPSSEIMVGTGFDVHEFCTSDKGSKAVDDKALYLGGIKINDNFGLKAHSDGDVVLHALIDALFGASMLNDIGHHYSDKDQKYKDISSSKLLDDAYKMIQGYGFELANADITIMCEKPKLGEYKEKIRKNLCDFFKTHKINVKATTTEKLGFVGRGEGIACIACVGLRYFKWQKYL